MTRASVARDLVAIVGAGVATQASVASRPSSCSSSTGATQVPGQLDGAREGWCESSVAAAAVVDELPAPATLCADEACGAELTQAPTGRPRLFCDATCRANARRARVWEQYEAELDVWFREQTRLAALHAEARAAWEAVPYVDEPAWAVEARKHGWSPPYSYRRVRPGVEPVLVVPPRPAPPNVSRPRAGRRGEYSW